MKQILAIAALLFSLPASSQEVVTIIWDVSGVVNNGINNDVAVEQIRIDTRWNAYGSVNGIVSFEGNSAAGATGTCFFLSSNQIICEIDVRNVEYTLRVDGDSGDGELSISDSFGLLDSGLLTLVSSN